MLLLEVNLPPASHQVIHKMVFTMKTLLAVIFLFQPRSQATICVVSSYQQECIVFTMKTLLAVITKMEPGTSKAVIEQQQQQSHYITWENRSRLQRPPYPRDNTRIHSIILRVKRGVAFCLPTIEIDLIFFCDAYISVALLFTTEQLLYDADNVLFRKVLIDGHCLHHLIPPVKTLSIQLRPASRSCQLPICKYMLYKRSFIVRCLFNCH